jgi:hypothetical protein
VNPSSGGAIAAAVILPIISIIMIGTLLMIRRGIFFQNVSAFNFIRKAGRNHQDHANQFSSVVFPYPLFKPADSYPMFILTLTALTSRSC